MKSGNYDPSKSKSWNVLETVLSHLNSRHSIMEILILRYSHKKAVVGSLHFTPDLQSTIHSLQSAVFN